MTKAGGGDASGLFASGPKGLSVSSYFGDYHPSRESVPISFGCRLKAINSRFPVINVFQNLLEVEYFERIIVGQMTF